MMPGAHFVPRNDITALEQAVSERTAGIVIELVQGEGGIYPLTAEFVRKARELADRYNALLMFDETQCGVGRPGTYFAYQLLDPSVMPDVTVAAKPMACGIPLGVCRGQRAGRARRSAPASTGQRSAADPLACRVALEFFDILDELLPSITNVGSYFRMRLTELARQLFVHQRSARLRVDDRRGAGISRQADRARLLCRKAC